MRKSLLIMSIMIIVILTACTNKPLSPLEKRVREFDYYTEIVDFTDDHTNVKLLAAYNEDSSDVSYIYYMDEIVSDYEILFFVEDEIVHEDFVVADYSVDGTIIGEFTVHQLSLSEDVNLSELRLVRPGFHNNDRVGVVFIQEFNLVTSTRNIEDVDREFSRADDYQDKDIEVAEVNITNIKSRNAFFITFLTGFIVYFISIYLYKGLYEKIITYKFNNPDNTKYRFIPDLNIFKYGSAIFILIVCILLFIVLQSSITKKYNSVELYDKYDANYEEIIADEVSLKIGRTRYEENTTAFVSKDVTHHVMGDLKVKLYGDYNHKAFIPEGDYGSYEFKVSYRFLKADTMSVEIFDNGEWNGEQMVYDLVFFREVKLNER